MVECLSVSSFRLALLVIGLTSASAFALPPKFLGTGKPIVSAGQKPEKARLFFLKDHATFGSSIVSGSAHLWESANGVLVQFGGVGGNIQQYGSAAQSTLNFSGVSSKQGWFPFVFENPIYLGARDWDLTARKKQADQFSKLDAQLDWYTTTLEKIFSEAGNRKCAIFGRSTGGALLTQWFRKGIAGDERILNLLRRTEIIVLGGVTGYQEDIMARWTAVEDQDKGNPDIYDAIATEADRKLYIDMRTRASELPNTTSGLPPVLAIGAAQDETLSLEDQLRVVQEYSRLTPGARFVFLKTDGKHDPTQGYQVVRPDKVIDVKQASLFKDVLMSAVPVALSAKETGLHIIDMQYPIYPFGASLSRERCIQTLSEFLRKSANGEKK